MCGIIAYLGSSDAVDMILSSLSLLQNRGYDSAGICTINHTINEFLLHKFASRPDQSGIERLEAVKETHRGHTIGIGHTRWATHGPKTDKNAHPHLDTKQQFAVVHNGIIENYMELKHMLEQAGYVFESQTDTEVIPKLLAYHFDKAFALQGGDIHQIHIERDVIKKTIQQLEGTWALCILCTWQPNTIYLCKNGSPLVLSYNQDCLLVASEQLPLSIYFNNYISLNDHDMVTITRDLNGGIQFRNELYTERSIENKVSETSCTPYPHWTMKEIYEQPASILRTLNMGGRLIGDHAVKLGGLDAHQDDILSIDHLILLGCGTSYHAGQIGVKMIQQLKCVDHVTCIDASEFTELDIPTQGRTGFVLLSQSGETKDLHRIIPLIRQADCPIMAIVNVVGSLISRESDCGIYLNAGREVGVASTKSFTSQVVALALLGLWYSQHKQTQPHLRMQYIKHVRSLSMDVSTLLTSIAEPIKELAKMCVTTEHMFLLGRGVMKYVADEGALKIKEIAYVHAEGYAGGALKHGPFALIDSNTVVILLAPQDENFTKMIHAASEIHSRGARILLFTNPTESTSVYPAHLFDKVITIPYNTSFQTVLSIIPLQLLAYEVAVLKGYNPDFPRNLAKVVTVDG